jgi:glycine/sarcosine N-methyltransferase
MYDQFAHDYDRFVNWEKRLSFELPLLETMLKEIDASETRKIRVLDSACGTGMHAIALARAGYDVTGADLSAEMIDKARQNAQAARIELPFVAAGFGSLTSTFGSGQFDAVLCLGNSLPHLLTEKELKAAINDFYACLKPGGMLLIQNRNFDAVLKTRNRWMEPQTFQDNEGEWIFQRFYDFNPDGSIRFNMVTLHRQGASEWSSSVGSTLLIPQRREDLQKILSEVGFSSQSAFGSLSGELFDHETSENLILFASKPLTSL